MGLLRIERKFMPHLRDSIIVSTIRTFCTSFAAIIGVLIAFVFVLICVSRLSPPDLFPPKSQLTISADANGNRDLLPSSAPVLLKIDIHGVIGDKDLTFAKIRNMLLDSREGILDKGRVKGILLSLNTPGGLADDSDAIYRELLAYKEKYQVPIYAFVDGLCASGGMYIASAADRIYATPSSIIGSVGVILGPLFNFSSLMERYGVQGLNVTAGKDKDMLSAIRPWKPGEDASLKSITNALYERFVSIVVNARPELSKEKLINEYGAHIFIANKAKEYGYIDVADASSSLVLCDLAKAANLTEEMNYQVLAISPMHSFVSDLVQNKLTFFKGEINHKLPIAPYINSDFSGRFLYLYQPGNGSF